jgi:S-DNA-T family DNA segregation ATPase FtsK/SpoIIIE
MGFRWAVSILLAMLRDMWAVLWGVVVWTWRHTGLVVAVATVGVMVRLFPKGQPLAIQLLVAAWWVPALISVVWGRWWPVSYARIVAGPSARIGWMVWARRRWAHLARECDLSVYRERPRPLLDRIVDTLTSHPAPVTDRKEWVHPRLCAATARGVTLTITVRTRTGQTVDDLEKAAPALSAAANARSFRFRALSPSTAEYVLVMADRLDQTTEAVAPVGVHVDAVPVGRRQDGSAWLLPVIGRHTLVVGCSGSGKGSIFWGVCGGLAPAVSVGLVRLWGVDLKRGVEVGMGRGLFSEVATTPAEAVDVLSRLLAVVDERGRRMAGMSRLHTPSPMEPLHVLAIDELAVLTAYSDSETRKEASRLLAEVLTQGRALGVVVLACVQDPRKEVVGLRGLFTQTVALRLRTADETRMVLGDGAAATAPAHRISPSAPGTAWVIEEDGSADRVRADFWPDPLVQAVATRHPAPQPVNDEMEGPASPEDLGYIEAVPFVPASVGETADSAPGPRARRPRSPRKPRRPRPTAASVASSESDLGGDAA